MYDGTLQRVDVGRGGTGGLPLEETQRAVAIDAADLRFGDLRILADTDKLRIDIYLAVASVVDKLVRAQMISNYLGGVVQYFDIREQTARPYLVTDLTRAALESIVPETLVDQVRKRMIMMAEVEDSIILHAIKSELKARFVRVEVFSKKEK